MIESDLALSNVKNQFYATVIANYIIFSHGSTSGWLSPALSTLRSKDSPLSTGPITNDDLSWIGSISSLGSMCGTFICGILSMLLGPKRAMIFLAFPPIVFWLLVHFGTTITHLLIARLATGLTGGGMQAGVALYVSEIANDDFRGRLGGLTPLARNSGLFTAFFASALVDYEYRAYVFISIPIMYLILLFTLPNTPQYYLKKGDFQKAEKSLKFYKGCEGKIEREKAFLDNEYERLRLVIEERRNSPKIRMKDFLNRMAVKGIVLSLAMSWFLQTTGCYLFTSFASIIFEKSGSSFSIQVSSIILAVVQITGGLVSTQMGDAFGRKTTLYLSLFGSAFGLFTFSGYMYLRHNGYDVSNYLWLPVTCISVVIFVSSAGIMALSNTCAIENFPPKIRTVGVVFYSLCVNCVGFTGDKLFPILIEIIHLHGFMLVLAVNCSIGLILVAFMDETKGTSLDMDMDTDNSTDNKLSDKNIEQNRF